MSRTSELDPLVNQFQHESQRRRTSEALSMLQKIASIVKPIMRQRNWRVGILAEFYPHETNLLGLNINRGQKICLRLRYPGDENQFLPFENIVDTMLHELCHIVVGPHNQEFHALWDKLRDEHEALLRKGYTGEGFLGRGERLGGGRIPLHEAKRRARAAAEKRRTLTAGSGQKLGGSGIMRGQNPRAVIAAAAEKRMKIERGCASNTETGRKVAREEAIKKEKVTTTQAEHDEDEEAILQAYIDMIQEEEREQLGDSYIPPSEANPAGMRGMTSPPGIRSSMVPPVSPHSLIEQQRQIEQNLQRNRDNAPETSTSAKAPPRERKPQPPPPRKLSPIEADLPETWTCEICTLVNPLQFLTCDACTTERPETYAKAARASVSSSHNSRREIPNALKPRLKVAESLAKLDKQAEYKKSQPIGWGCRCGNWMEQQWWTCSACGRMKASS